jgi:type I restriction enzyme, S subunit
MSEHVPEGWVSSKLKDVSVLTKGLTYASSDYSDEQNGLPFLTLKSISKDGGYSPVGLKFYKGEYREHHALNIGDVLFANTDLTRNGDVVGSPLFFDGFGFAETTLYSMDLSKLKVDPQKLHSKFLYYLLMTHGVKRYMVNSSAGSTVLHLDTNRVKELDLNIPPLPEQKKIASILTSVDEVIEKTQSQIDKLQDLKKGTMNELLTKGIGHTEFKDSELGRIPKSWEVKRLGDLFILTSGKSKPTRLLSPIMTKVNSIPVYGGNGVNGYTDSALLDNPTIVIGRVGEYCGCVEVTPIFSWITDNALYIKSVLQKYDMMFLFYLMTFSNLSKLRSKGGQPLVSQQPIHEYSVALPSVEEQQNISGIISAINDKIEIQNKKLSQTQSLKKSLMQDLLTGKVRVSVN